MPLQLYHNHVMFGLSQMRRLDSLSQTMLLIVQHKIWTTHKPRPLIYHKLNLCTDGLSQTCAIIASHTSAPACNRRFSAATAAAAEAAAPAHTCHLSWWLWPMQAHSLHQPHSHSTPTLQRLHCWAAIAHGKAQIEPKFALLGSHSAREGSD